MKVLIVGSGGREHALAWKVKQSPLLSELYCAPGNAGTASIANNVDLDPVANKGALALWAVENKIDLTIVGPEAPLADGLVDIFQEHGLRVFGPRAAAARLESSKAFSKEVMLKVGVDTAAGDVFDDFKAAKAYVEMKGAPIVIKADGLAAGKGVVVAPTVEEAIKTLESFMLGGQFGEGGKTVVVEECLVGREASVIVLVDQDTILPLVVSQDYKRLLDADQGPNTGGMGAISPTPVLTDHYVENLVGKIFLPVVKELWSRGIPYRGFLYAGVMVDRSGLPRVLEFNCRLGDPETEVLLPRMQSDLLAVIDSAVSGNLGTTALQWRPEAAACVVAASRGYPGSVDDGKEITGLEPATDELQSFTNVFHAGTKLVDGKVVSKGGRILVVSALGDTLNKAVKRAYERLSSITFEGQQYRTDIGGGAW